jgi:DNA-binding PadR family transcriptional regulator
MMLDIESFAGHRLGPGTLYGAITRMEGRGWIQADASSERRRSYRISAAGRDHLQMRITALDKVVRIAVRRLKQGS